MKPYLATRFFARKLHRYRSSRKQDSFVNPELHPYKYLQEDMVFSTHISYPDVVAG